jgi:hypothetical protein
MTGGPASDMAVLGFFGLKTRSENETKGLYLYDGLNGMTSVRPVRKKYATSVSAGLALHRLRWSLYTRSQLVIRSHSLLDIRSQQPR